MRIMSEYVDIEVTITFSTSAPAELAQDVVDQLDAEELGKLIKSRNPTVEVRPLNRFDKESIKVSVRWQVEKILKESLRHNNVSQEEIRQQIIGNKERSGITQEENLENLIGCLLMADDLDLSPGCERDLIKEIRESIEYDIADGNIDL